MPKYLVKATYTTEGARGLLKDGGSARRDVATKLLESVGGKVESLYFAFGSTDVFVIADMPDNVSAAAASLAVNASGAVTTEVVALLTAEDVDAAAKRAPAYQAPGS